ncbi:membrane hypothetical protein [Candidatus Sulfopaludibacter sp. SbA3]|nr:membrane hypothetical protein [Candidatus Sulfopaludibacter sp. SbA3]
MKATTFEYRHQTLLHMLLVGLASLSYLRNRVDIVWAIVRHHSDSSSWERLVFGFGALLLLASAALETWANAPSHDGYRQQQMRVARILLVLAVGLLLPLPGTIVLLAGETILILRLFLRGEVGPADLPFQPCPTRVSLRSAFRIAASKWGLAASMIVFVCTLQDRIAEIGAACSVVLWLALNAGGPGQIEYRLTVFSPLQGV